MDWIEHLTLWLETGTGSAWPMLKYSWYHDIYFSKLRLGVKRAFKERGIIGQLGIVILPAPSIRFPWQWDHKRAIIFS